MDAEAAELEAARKIAADADAEEIALARAAQAEVDAIAAAATRAELDQAANTAQAAMIDLAHDAQSAEWNKDLAKYDEVTQVRLF